MISHAAVRRDSHYTELLSTQLLGHYWICFAAPTCRDCGHAEASGHEIQDLSEEAGDDPAVSTLVWVVTSVSFQCGCNTDSVYAQSQIRTSMWNRICRRAYTTPSTKLVSRWTMSIRRKDISLRVFSNMIRGSSDWHRRQFGAMTMARLFTSILVIATLAG